MGPKRLQPTKIRVDSFFSFPIDGERVPLSPTLLERSKYCNSVNDEMSPNSVPSNPIPARVMDVTRESVQLIPSQELPQGSDPFQFGGKLLQLDLMAFRAATCHSLSIVSAKSKKFSKFLKMASLHSIHGSDSVNTPETEPIKPSELRSEFSHHDPTVARINNGSFGCCPSTIISAQQRHQLLFLRQPDYYYFNTLKPSILNSRRIIQSLINADHVDEVSIVDNVTTAAAIVLQHYTCSFFSSSFQPGDAAIILRHSYTAVKKAVQAYISRAGGHIIEVPIPFPARSDDEIISEFENALELARANGRKIRLALIDHITSMPSFITPVKKLVKLCRNQGVDRIFVDGAQAIGNVEIDVKDIDADFYTSNLHKWLFCPPSAALLYCKTSNESSDLHHLVISHDYGNGLAMESGWVGTRDYSAQLVLPEVMEFVSRFEGGIGGIMKRNHQKVVEMAEMLAIEWGTELGAPPEMCSSMAMVGLPVCLGINSDEDAAKLRTYLRECFGIEVHMYCRAPIEGEIDGVTGYARISYQVYNVDEDYYRFRDAVNKLVNDGFTCELLPK